MDEITIYKKTVEAKERQIKEISDSLSFILDMIKCIEKYANNKKYEIPTHYLQYINDMLFEELERKINKND